MTHCIGRGEFWGGICAERLRERTVSDRDAVVGLMNGLAKLAKGQVDPSSPPGSASRFSTSPTILWMAGTSLVMTRTQEFASSAFEIAIWSGARPA